MRVAFVCFLMVTITFNVFANDEVRVWSANTTRQQTIDFIALALDKTQNGKNTTNVIAVDVGNQQQAISSLEHHDLIDLVVAGTDRDWESRLLPVYIPLDRGLLGLRVCLTSQQHITTLSNIHVISDFERLGVKVGVADSWPDYDVYRQYQMPLETTSSHANLYSLLQDNKAQCLSRSVFEIEQELSQFPEFLGDRHLALVYPLADIIYVNPRAKTLHTRLQLGLERAIDDGSFDALFEKHYGVAMEHLDFYSRKLLVLDNPSISVSALNAINHFGVISFNQIEATK